ncbi:MAG: hypothetical protein VYC19_01290 [Pseudomonadota bacterium]|nr:hypothetical protein [Pseudomonadota bacterium]MEE3322967.1 hypothetical protein [Pseudomonadota bacterium]
MDNHFRNAAGKLPKNVYLVYTDGLVDSLRAADMIKTVCQSSTNGEDAHVYFLDALKTVYLDDESELKDYALNCHGYTHNDHKKACHVFQDYLQEKYDIESTCLTSKYTGGTQNAIYKMFENEDANNVVVISSQSLADYIHGEVHMARSGQNGMTKHVQYEIAPCDTPSQNNTTALNCPAKEQYNRQL